MLDELIKSLLASGKNVSIGCHAERLTGYYATVSCADDAAECGECGSCEGPTTWSDAGHGDTAYEALQNAVQVHLDNVKPPSSEMFEKSKHAHAPRSRAQRWCGL